MSDPVRAADTPYATDVEEGKTYYWCSCGKSSKQPLCDGSHQGTDFTPVAYQAEASKKVFFAVVKFPITSLCVMAVTSNTKNKEKSTNA